MSLELHEVLFPHELLYCSLNSTFKQQHRFWYRDYLRELNYITTMSSIGL
jgi:hypothetical protein